MPAKLSLTLDASQYQQQLEAVIRQTRKAAKDMSANQKITITADTAAAENALASLPQAPDQEITVSSDTDPAEKVIDEIPESQDQIFTIFADTDPAEQSISVIPEAPDQEIIVTADTKPAEKALSDLTGKADKTVSQSTEKAARPASFSLKSVWKELTSLDGGAKQFVKTMLAGGGLIGIAMAGVQSVVELCTMALDAMAAKGKEAADSHRQFADSIAEAAANNDRLKQSANEAITQLAAMGNAAKLSNAEQEKAVSLIAQLTRQYGDLGLSVDKATGKIKGLGSAIIEKENRDAQRQIRTIEAQLRERRSAREQEDRNISEAGYNVGKINKTINWFNPIGIIRNLTGWTNKGNAAWGLDETQIGGEQDTKEASERRAKDGQEIQKLEMQRQEAKKQLEQIRIQNAALEEEKKECDKLAKYRATDNELGRIKYAEEAKADYERSSNSADQIGAERKSVTAHAEIQTEKENIFSLERQIQKLKKEEAEANKQRARQQQAETNAVKQKKEGQQYEFEYNRLILAGEYDKAAVLKLEHELKQRNLKLTEAEKKAILDQQKAQKALALQKSNRDKAQDLKYRAMEKTGQGKEASEQRALRDAERTKGSKLTDKEIDATKRLHELTWELDNRRGPDFGDLSIKTNDLTQRGGFQGGAVAPDKDKYNQQIATENKAMHAILERIESMVSDFGKF